MKTMRTVVAAVLLTAAASAANAGEAAIFVYSPGPTQGLHVARLNSDGWQHIGQLCASDYGPWGAEKKMYHPTVTRCTDGTWRLVFQVNDKAPCLAVAYSADLTTWRPQDYPRQSVRGCLQPVVAEQTDGNFAVVYRTKDGKRQFVASRDFRRFSIDTPSTAGDALWQRDTATIDGIAVEGNRFVVTAAEADHIGDYFRKTEEDNRLSQERMHDDKTRLARLTGTLKATLNVDETGEKAISDKLVGIFFEDISYAADGGLYAEMVQNRDFEYSEDDRRDWEPGTAWHSPSPIRIDVHNPLHENNRHFVILEGDSLVNDGWDGMAVEKGKNYRFSIYVRGKKKVRVQLIDPSGKAIAQATLKARSPKAWRQYELRLTPVATCDKARLLLLPLNSDPAHIDMVSLFPEETFRGHRNGLRKDLAETIAALHPKFMRFPGGCMSHGQGIDNIYHWQETVGPLYARKPAKNIWHYHQTRGLGFYEYFQFCEDIGAEPLPVLAAGVPCQNSAADNSGMAGQQDGIPLDQMPAYIDELCNLIDWANADPRHNEWARLRAEAGHPEPFNLKYIGIGNEDLISTTFEVRYRMICQALRERHPEIKVCGTVGPFHAPSPDYIEGWDFTNKNPGLQYMTDEHYYESTGWFMHHRDYYDNYSREGTKVYLGEWAASTKTKRPNVETALAEALYMTDLERNADVVVMSSYAPMLCKDGHSNWNPDMIYFSNTAVRTTPAYEVQRLFSVNSGDRYVKSSLTLDDPALGDLHHRLGSSLVRDSKTGQTFLKLVNALPVALTVSVRGLAIPPTAPTEGFAGQPEQQRLSSERGTVGSSLVLPPYSLTVVTL